MQALPQGGAMVSLQASEDEVRALLQACARPPSLAALNGPLSTVIAGDEDAVARNRPAGRSARTQDHAPARQPRFSLPSHGRDARRLPARRPVASPSIPPRIPTHFHPHRRARHRPGARLARNWVRHVRDTVRFLDGVRTLDAEGARVFLELGPHPVLSALAHDALEQDAEPSQSAFLPTLRKGRDDAEAFTAALGALHTSGLTPDWNAFFNVGQDSAFAGPSNVGRDSAFAGPSNVGRDSAFAGPSNVGRDSAFAGPSTWGRDSAFAGPSNVGRDSAFAGPSNVGRDSASRVPPTWVGTPCSRSSAPFAPRKVSLPTYAFQRERFWLDASKARAEGAVPLAPLKGRFWQAIESSNLDALSGELHVDGDEQRAALALLLPTLSSFRHKRQEQSTVDAWRYQVTWKPLTTTGTPEGLAGSWLVVVPAALGDDALLATLTEALTRRGARVLTLRLSAAHIGRGALAEHLGQAFAEAGPLRGVLSLLALDERPLTGHSALPAGLALSLALVQALGDLALDAFLWLFTRGAVSIGHSDPLAHPTQAMTWGFGRVVGLETPSGGEGWSTSALGST